MTKNSNKNREINGSLPDHSAVAHPTQNQTAILITNEQPRIENEVSKAVSAENNRQQKRKCCSWETVIVVLVFFLPYWLVRLLRKIL